MDSTFFWFLLASLVLLIINGRLRTDRRGIHLKMRYEGDGVGAYDVAIHSGLWITAAWLALHSHPESALTLISLSLLVGLISLSVYLLYGPLPTEYQVFFYPASVVMCLLCCILSLVALFAIGAMLLWIWIKEGRKGLREISLGES